MEDKTSNSKQFVASRLYIYMCVCVLVITSVISPAVHPKYIGSKEGYKVKAELGRIPTATGKRLNRHFKHKEYLKKAQ